MSSLTYSNFGLIKDLKENMIDCRFSSMLSAYHDGELNIEQTQSMQEHLPTCATCTRELKQVEAISNLFANETIPQLSMMEQARLHKKIESREESDLLRTAGLLSALAASVLIVSTVWLAELPSRHTAAVSPAVAVLPASESPGQMTPAWERVATSLHVDPRPDFPFEDPTIQTGFADAGAFGNNSTDVNMADWMVAGLAGQVNR